MARIEAIVHALPAGNLVVWHPTTLEALGKSEDYLEGVIEKHPELLHLESRRSGIRGPYVGFRQISFSTPQGRVIRPDLVLLAASGHIIVVEVKRASNSELRNRQVLAQIVDYAASFSALGAEAIHDLFNRSGDSKTWAGFIAERFPSEARRDELADCLMSNMRNGNLNLVIACDGVPIGLPEVVKGVASQSALGFSLDLVEIVPYVPDSASMGDQNILFVPSIRLSTEIVARTAIHVTYEQGTPQPEVRVETTPIEDIEEGVQAAVAGNRRLTQDEIHNAFFRNGSAIEKELLEFACQHAADGCTVPEKPRGTPAFGFYIRGRNRGDGRTRTYQLFRVTLDCPTLCLWMDTAERFLDEPDLTDYRQRLIKLSGNASDFTKPQSSLDIRLMEVHLESFKELMLWAQARASAAI